MPGPELIISADDYGYSSSVNRAIALLALEGRITSFGLMVNFDGAAEVAGIADKLPTGFSIGLHLNLTEGRPIIPTSQVSSLVQPNGQFFPPAQFVRRLLLKRIRSKELQAEVLAQVRQMVRLLGRVSHFDSHHHVHRFPAVMNALASAASAMRAPRRIRCNRRYLVSANGGGGNRFRLYCRHYRSYPCALLGLYFKARQRCLFQRHSFSAPDYLLTTIPPVHCLPIAPAIESWSRILVALPRATFEVNFHPGRPTEEERLLFSPGFERALQVVQPVSYYAVGPNS